MSAAPGTARLTSASLARRPADTQPGCEQSAWWRSPSPEVAKILLAKGYALAGSAYAREGWTVIDGVISGEQLYARFVTMIGKPRRTYLWGVAGRADLHDPTLDVSYADRHARW